MSTTEPDTWDEESSTTFITWGDLFVPDRMGQINTLLDLLPAQPSEQFTIIELASGAGLLAQHILERFPHCHYLALDGSEKMRERFSHNLAAYSERISVQHFDLADHSWRASIPKARCIVSSLAIHHLPGEAKRQLYIDLSNHLEPGGALLIADIVQPASAQIAQLYARQYDQIVRDQSLQRYHNSSGFDQFCAEQWNYFSNDYYTPEATIDMPSLLSDQLLWLQEAGLKPVDCFWLRAGHAVFGGYKPNP